MLHAVHIPAHELDITFVRSGGKGGQNVNKLATKAVVRFNIFKSKIFSNEEKERLARKLSTQLNYAGDIIVVSERERNQLANKIDAIKKLEQLVTRALRVPKARRATKPTRNSKLRRLETKQKHSHKKRNRKSTFE